MALYLETLQNIAGHYYTETLYIGHFHCNAMLPSATDYIKEFPLTVAYFRYHRFCRRDDVSFIFRVISHEQIL